MFILIISQHSPSLDRPSLGQLLLTSLYSLPKSSNSSSSTSCCNNLRFISSSIAAARRILALPPGLLPPKPPSVESRSIWDLLSSILTSFVSYGAALKTCPPTTLNSDRSLTVGRGYSNPSNFLHNKHLMKILLRFIYLCESSTSIFSLLGSLLRYYDIPSHVRSA